MDGAAATKEIFCKMEKPIREDRQYVAGLGAGRDMFDGLEKEMDLKGTGLEPYYYRDTLTAMKAHGVVLIGGWAHRGPPAFYIFRCSFSCPVNRQPLLSPKSLAVVGIPPGNCHCQ
jgi:hypothetical protein